MTSNCNQNLLRRLKLLQKEAWRTRVIQSLEPRYKSKDVQHSHERVIPYGDVGSVTVETALGFMVTMVMMLGIIECCMMAYTYSVLQNAVRDGVHYAVVHGTDSANCSGPSAGCADTAASNVVQHVSASAGQYVTIPTGMSVSVTYPDGASTPGARVRVALGETYQPLFHVGWASQIISFSSEARIIY